MRLYLTLLFFGFLIRDQPEEGIVRHALRRYGGAIISPLLFWNGLVILLACLFSLSTARPFLEHWLLFFLSLQIVLATVWFIRYNTIENGHCGDDDWSRIRNLTIDRVLSRESAAIGKSMRLPRVPVVLMKNVRGHAVIYCRGRATRIVASQRFLSGLPPSARPGLFAHELAHFRLRHPLILYCRLYASLSSLIAFPLTVSAHRCFADCIAGLSGDKPVFRWRARLIHVAGPMSRFFQFLSIQQFNQKEEYAADAVAALVVGRQSVRELLEHLVHVEQSDGAWDPNIWQKNHPPLRWRIHALEVKPRSMGTSPS